MAMLAERVDGAVAVDAHPGHPGRRGAHPRVGACSPRHHPRRCGRLPAVARRRPRPGAWPPRVAVDGAGSYGAGLAALLQRGERVVEVGRPKRPASRSGANSRYQAGGVDGLRDRSKRPLVSPRATHVEVVGKTGPNPTDRGKPGSKYHLLTDHGGIPLAVRLSAATTHDSVLPEQLVDAIPAVNGPRGRPGRPRQRPAKLHLDKAYDYPAAGGRCAAAASPRGSPGVASSPASGWAGIGGWWSGRWRGWWATGGCRSATSGAPTSCWGSCSWPAR
jgi:hypothetical protein